jgi:3-oxoacyl-[acyl-carrier protein] reductase
MVLAEAGADVVVCDIVADTGELANVAKAIRGLGRKALAVRADVKKKKDVDRVVSKTLERFGRIDILVNNAGVGDGGFVTEKRDYNPERARAFMAERMKRMENSAAIVEMNMQAWDLVMENNVKSVLLMTQAVAPAMIKQKSGKIVNISSVRANAHGPGAAANYAVSKRDLLMITEGTAGQLARFGVRVNAILPGGIMTEMMRGTWADPERRKAMGEMMPLANDLIGPETVAHTALYLCSDLGKFVTGQFITVDAGMWVTGDGR